MTFFTADDTGASRRLSVSAQDASTVQLIMYSDKDYRNDGVHLSSLSEHQWPSTRSASNLGGLVQKLSHLARKKCFEVLT